MAAQFDEHQQFADPTTGTLVVNGYIYIGTQGADPKLNLITIYSDRALTSVLANPQRTDSSGQAANKIWIPGRYSVKVEDLNNVQLYENLDNGEAEGVGTAALTNIIGINAITAEGAPTITSYVDQQAYSLKIASTNTLAMTLNIDSLGAKAIKRNIDQGIVKGQFVQNENAIVIYNSSTDQFIWSNENQKVEYQNKGIAIASAATIDLSAATGNTIHVTGNTGPVVSLGIGVPGGSEFTMIFDSNPTFTHGANLIMPDAANRVMAIGDIMPVVSEGSDVWRVKNIFPAIGGSIWPSGYLKGVELSNNSGDAVNDIDIAIGQVAAENISSNIALTAILVKQIDANWAVGSAAGGFPSGLTLTNDTWYHLFLIKRSDTGVVDAGFDTSATAANLLADATDYDAYRRVGSIRRGTATNLAFGQQKNIIYWDTLPTYVDPATGNLTLLTPPDVECLAHFTVLLTGNGLAGLDQGTLRPTSGSHTTSTFGGEAWYANPTTHVAISNQDVMTNTSSQVYNIDNVSGAVTISLLGYTDYRGTL